MDREAARASEPREDAVVRRVAVALVLVLGLAIRLYLAWTINQRLPNSAQRLTHGDEPGFNDLALALLSGQGMTWPGRPPLYPFWLATLHAVSGESYRLVPYAQAFLGTLTVFLVYRLGRSFTGFLPSLVAALVAAVSYVLTHQSLHFLSEVLFTPVLLAVALSLVKAVREPGWRSAAAAGAWIGISDLVRPTLILFPLFAGLTLLVRLGWRRGLRLAVVLGVATGVVVAPWTAYNYAKWDAFIPLATSNAILWQGSPEYYNLIHEHGYTYMQIWTEVLYPPDSEAPYPYTVEGDAYWTGRAVRSILDEPVTYVRYALEKSVTYWVGDPNADWGNTHVFNFRLLREHGYGRAAVLGLAFARLVLPLLALAGIAVLWRRWREWLPLYAILVYTTLLHAATHAEARLSEPFHPLLLVVVSAAAARLMARASCGPRRPARRSP